MDKSLGWLKSKAKKNIDTRKVNCTFKSAKKTFKSREKCCDEQLSVISLAFPSYSNEYLMSTPKLGKVRSQFSQTSLYNSNNDESSFSLNNSKNCEDFSHFILLNAPSMASSFDEIRLHSTPRHSVSRHSRLFDSQQEISSLLSFNNSTCRSQSCHFGMTSSPNTFFNQNLQFAHQNSQNTEQSRIQFDESEHYTSYEYLNSREQKLVDHLNRIKQNVRLGIELRDQVKRGETFKRTYHSTKAEEESLEQKSSENKRRKLQHIFHVKLHRQIKEIKKWQTALKNKFESKSEATENLKRNQTSFDELYSSNRNQFDESCDSYYDEMSERFDQERASFAKKRRF